MKYIFVSESVKKKTKLASCSAVKKLHHVNQQTNSFGARPQTVRHLAAVTLQKRNKTPLKTYLEPTWRPVTVSKGSGNIWKKVTQSGWRKRCDLTRLGVVEFASLQAALVHENVTSWVRVPVRVCAYWCPTVRACAHFVGFTSLSSRVVLHDNNNSNVG